MKSLRRAGRWFQRQPRKRPFGSVLVILLVIVVPGYFRLENAVDSANKSSAQVKAVVQRERTRDEASILANCQTRNTANKNGRNRFDVLFNSLEVIFSNGQTDPERQKRVKEFVDSLRAHVPLDAAAEDVDCNHNGFLEPQDYGT